MNKICKVLTGSRLYGTERSDSDFDLRGIFLPSLRDCYQGAIKDVINAGPEEVYYSIHKFLDLATTGQPIALEMLFAPETHVGVNKDNERIWNILLNYRYEFLNKKMEAFLGFGRSLANKYAVKSERLKALNDLYNEIDYRDELNHNLKISSIWEILPTDEFCQKEIDSDGRVFYTVLSRKYRGNTSIKDFLVALNGIRDDYGERVKAAESGQFDAKSVSHCFRICYQLQDMATLGKFIFPLKQVGFLKKLKNKEVDYQRDDIFEKLDFEIKNTEIMLENCPLPDKVRDGIKEEILDKIYRQLYEIHN